MRQLLCCDRQRAHRVVFALSCRLRACGNTAANAHGLVYVVLVFVIRVVSTGKAVRSHRLLSVHESRITSVLVDTNSRPKDMQSANFYIVICVVVVAFLRARRAINGQSNGVHMLPQCIRSNIAI